MPVNASRNRDVRRLLRQAEFDATDQRDRDEFIRDFTDPSILGLKASDASAAADALRTAMISRIAAEDVDDDGAPGTDSSEAPADQTDDVELVEDDDATSPDDAKEKPEGPPEGLLETEPDGDVDDAADGLQGKPFGEEVEIGAPDLGDLFSLDREEVGFPDEDEDEGVGGDEGSDLPPWLQGGGEEPPEGEGASVSLEGEGDEVTISLPGGGSLELEYKPGKEGPVAPGAATTEEVLAMAQDTQRVAAATQPAAQDVLRQRAMARRAMIAQAQTQTPPEHIDPDTEKKLGVDTSFGGEKFVMQDGQTAVATPNQPEARDTSTMQNSEGNSLLSWDSSFAGNEIAMLDQGNQMNVGAKDKFTFQDPRAGSVFTRTFDATPIDIPTMGGTDDLWGAKNLGEFDLVTQQPQNTGERIHTRRASAADEAMSVFATPDWEYRVARACSEKQCMGGCSTPGSVEPVPCKECGVVYAMCDDCITSGNCPVCTGNSRDVEAQINWDSYCQDAGQRGEVCEDRRGDDVNGDGGFRTRGTQSGTPKTQDARDMKVDAGEYEEKLAAIGEANRQLRAQNERLQVEMVRLAKAAEVTLEMIDAGQASAAQGMQRIDEFVSSDMDVPALESLRRIAASLPKQQHEVRVASVADAMTRTAGAMPIQNAGVFVNPNPTTPYVPQERLASVLSEVLSSGLPREEDFDPETGRQIRRR